LGQKSEGRPVLAEINNNSRFELLGGDFEQTWANCPIPSGLFIINNSSASFMYAITIKAEGFGFPVHVLETQAGVTRQLVDSQLVHINEIHAITFPGVVRYDEIFLPLFAAGDWRGTTGTEDGTARTPLPANRPAFIKRGTSIWLQPGNMRGSLRFGIYSVNGRCVGAREISGINSDGRLFIAAGPATGSVPQGVYVAQVAASNATVNCRLVLCNP
jgi:hypothetical protein